MPTTRKVTIPDSKTVGDVLADLTKPSIDQPNYLDVVCRYCGEFAALRVKFKDGTSVLCCPAHGKDFIPTVDFRALACPGLPRETLPDYVEGFELWPPEQNQQD